MKVVNLNPIIFKGTVDNSTSPINTAKINTKANNIQEISNVTPDYNIKTPQKYTNLGIIGIGNGLKLHSFKLSNGYRVSIVPMEGSPAVVKSYVNVGSMNENEKIKGISHFLEHMAFNGTTGENGYYKLNTGDTFKDIEKMGGWCNASTNYSVTDYVNSTPMLEDKDLEKQIEILAAMTEDLALTEKMIEKEKGPVCSEINMIMDDPQTIAMDQTVRTLFNIKSSADELIGGSVNHIQNLTRNDVKEYYEKFYTPDNMNIVITGDVNPDEVINIVAKNFKKKITPKQAIQEKELTPIQTTIRKDFKTDKTNSTNIVIGFAGQKCNNTKDNIIYSILSSYLFATEVGLEKEAKKLHSFIGMSGDKISTSKSSPTLLTVYANCADNNSEKVLKLLYDKLSNLKAPSKETLDNIKKDILKSKQNDMEYSIYVNNQIGHCLLDDDMEQLTDYEKILNEITPEDIINYKNKYLDLNKAAITIVHPNVNSESVINNYNEAKSLTFKSKQRLPINMSNVEKTTLQNNCDVAFIKTKNNNISYSINFETKIPQNIKPGTENLLNIIYQCEKGTANISEDDFNKIQEKENLSIFSTSGKNIINVYGSTSPEKFKKSFALAKEVIYNPNITQESLDYAKARIKDTLARKEDDSYIIYRESPEGTNPFYSSKKEILENVDNISVNDIKELQKYILDNAKCTISMNIPENGTELKETAISEFNSLQQVQPNKYDIETYYKPNQNTQVLTSAKPTAQADISQTFKYKNNDTLEETIKSDLLGILMNTSSVGLFKTLREKEHLAYSVHANNSTLGDCGEFSCNILTTTDDKDSGKPTYENVQKSIDGFNRQIGKILNSEYTDEDLDAAKRILKADYLNNEGTVSKVNSIRHGLKSKYGIDYDNQLYSKIDSMTRKDVDEFAQTVFANPPIYSIVASQETLDANKDYFDSLKNN